MKYALAIAALLLTSMINPRGPAVKVGDGIQPQAAVDADGNVYVVYVKGGNPVVAVSTDRGKTFGDAVTAIDLGGSFKGGKQRGPRIGVDAKKNVYVTMPHDANLDLAVSTDAGKTFGKPVRVNDKDKSAPEMLHWLAVQPSGEAHVAWLDTRDGKEMALYYAKVAGGKAGANVRLQTPVCNCCAPGVAVDEKGNPVVVVRDGGQKASREIFLSRSSDGGKSFAKPQRVNKAETKING